MMKSFCRENENGATAEGLQLLADLDEHLYSFYSEIILKYRKKTLYGKMRENVRNYSCRFLENMLECRKIFGKGLTYMLAESILERNATQCNATH